MDVVDWLVKAVEDAEEKRDSLSIKIKVKKFVLLRNFSSAESSLKEYDKVLKIKRRSRSKREPVDFMNDEEEKDPLRVLAEVVIAAAKDEQLINSNSTGNESNEVSDEKDGFSTTEASFSTKKHVMIKSIPNAESGLKEDDNKVPTINKRSRSKHKCAYLFNDKEEKVDVADQEWVPASSANMPSKKKQKNLKKSCDSDRHNPTTKKVLSSSMVPAYDLPQKFKNKISDMGGNEITLIIQKCLYNSDLSKQLNRLLMPLNQVINKGFLRQGELQVLANQQAIKVPLIQPLLDDLTDLTLVKWDMLKSSGKKTSNYVLRSNWMDIANANQFKVNDIVQVWSFRVQDQLWMALVKV